MRCVFCKLGPADGVTVYRVNEKGQPGVWACSKHVDRTDSMPDDETREVVSALEKATRVAELEREANK